MPQEFSQTTQISLLDIELLFIVRLYSNKVMITLYLKCTWKNAIRIIIFEQKQTSINRIIFLSKEFFNIVILISDL